MNDPKTGLLSSIHYDLVVNISHDGKAKGGEYKVHVANGNQWYQMQVFLDF